MFECTVQYRTAPKTSTVATSTKLKLSLTVFCVQLPRTNAFVTLSVESESFCLKEHFFRERERWPWNFWNAHVVSACRPPRPPLPHTHTLSRSCDVPTSLVTLRPSVLMSVSQPPFGIKSMKLFLFQNEWKRAPVVAICYTIQWNWLRTRRCSGSKLGGIYCLSDWSRRSGRTITAIKLHFFKRGVSEIRFVNWAGVWLNKTVMFEKMTNLHLTELPQGNVRRFLVSQAFHKISMQVNHASLQQVWILVRIWGSCSKRVSDLQRPS